ncbi:MAG: phosphoribosylamine--glycine ligase [Chitinophagales bacterium]
MHILLIGSGGREHALAWKIRQSKSCTRLSIAPGNPGTARVGINVPIPVSDQKAIMAFCVEEKVDMVVVGPEDPLVHGIVDAFRQDTRVQHIPVIGPDAACAQLEGSKAFAKAFMLRNGVQTPAYKEFSAADSIEAERYIRQHSMPVVLKADGLAAGKGVIIAQNADEAILAMRSMFDGKFGDAGNKIVIEEFLQGIELTVIILCDGAHYLILPPSKDYKKIGDGDTGLNTGGMGAVSPPSFVTDVFMQKVQEKIIDPTLRGLQKEGMQYTGFLYFGLFKCGEEPYVIEYNARMGDPETQVIMPRLQNDILDLFLAVHAGTLQMHETKTDPRACSTVILASSGYPEHFDKGAVISGLENVEDCMVFHAGTSMSDKGELITAGGRVLAVSAYGNDLTEALRTCYVNAGRIYYATRYFRRDIGWDNV